MAERPPLLAPLAFALALVLAQGLAAPAARAGERITGDGFSIEIPDGFSAIEGEPQAEQIRNSGGVVLKQAKPLRAKDAITAHIVVVPGEKDVWDVQTPPGCQRIAEKVARVTSGTLISAKVIEPPAGKACQALLSNAQSKRYRNQTTVLQGLKRHRTLVVCTRDHRDRAAEKACDAVVQGWQLGDRLRRARPRDPHGH
jgi:hypothetical protein